METLILPVFFSDSFLNIFFFPNFVSFCMQIVVLFTNLNNQQTKQYNRLLHNDFVITKRKNTKTKKKQKRVFF